MQHTLKTVFVFFLLVSCMHVFSQKKTAGAGNNTFLNPVLGGDYPDPTIVRDGKDYYMTHSAFDYVPGLTVWHSTDLVNWEPVSYALTSYIGSIWAPDICKHDGKFFIYFTVSGKGNFAVYANSPNGPWSTPVDLKIGGIDPCHIVDETGQRWLFTSGGIRAKLNADGLSLVPGSIEKVYDGWKFPDEWDTEGFALEGPKVKKIGQYYYLLCAEGGTAGPATSHMVTVARSKSINGPWENAPNNPLIHTYSANERWWSKGHGSLIDAPDGKWWIVYHSYEKDFLTMGRQTLLEPVVFTNDGWIKAPTGSKVDQPVIKPVQSKNTIDRLARLKDFRVGLEWKFYKKFDSSRVTVNNGVLTMKAQGKTPHESSPMMFVPGVHNYEISVRIDKDSATAAGILLFYNADFYVGTSFDSKRRYRWRKGYTKASFEHSGNNLLWLKIRNANNIVTGYFSYDGINWTKESWGMDISGYHHNTLYDFMSVLPGLFASGNGEVRFSEFKFTKLE